MRQIVIADTNEDGTLSREAFLFSSAHEGLEALTASRDPLTLAEATLGDWKGLQPTAIHGLSTVTRRPAAEDGYRAFDGPAPSSTYYCPKEGGEWTPIEEAPVEIRLRAGRHHNTLEAVGVL